MTRKAKPPGATAPRDPRRPVPAAPARRRAAAAEVLEVRRLLAGATLLADLNTSTGSASPGPFVATADGTVYFPAADGAHGRELFRSDGSAAGTRLVRDVNPGPGTGAIANSFDFPGAIAAAGDVVYFVGDDGVSGQELWKTDGTEAGTVRVKDINPGSGSAGIRNLTPTASGLAFFTATVPGTAAGQLWRTDGTDAGTFALGAATTGGTAAPVPVGAAGNMVLFRSTAGGTGDEPWVSDGTVAGTARLADLYPGTGSSGPTNLTAAAGGAAYFTAFDFSSATPYGVYRTDGTTVTRVKAFNADALIARELTWAGSKLFFVSGGSLWATDGTGAGTALVRTLQGASNLGAAGDAAGTVIYFSGAASAGDPAGFDLWRSDGTADGTVPVADIAPGTTSSIVASVKPVGDGSGAAYLLAAPDGSAKSYGVYRTAGTAATTVRLTPPAATANTFGSANTGGRGMNDSILVAGGRAYFSATTAAAGAELWSTTGTPAGTAMVDDLNAETAGSTPSKGVLLNGKLIFGAVGPAGYELYATDGTPGGTALVKNIAADTTDPLAAPNGSAPAGFVRIGSYVYFAATDVDGGRELWRTDGTAAGTTRVKDINPGTAGSSPSSLVAIGSTLYFAAADVGGGTELWRSDGTDAGTVRVRDISAGNGSSSPTLLTAVGTTLFFSATDPATGTELWKSDGTGAGTVLVYDAAPGSASSAPQELTPVGNVLYYTAVTAAAGRELWRSNGTGTGGGTAIVRDLYPGTNWSGATMLANLNGTLYFTGDAGDGNGSELFKTDGTPGGTVLVKEVAPGFGSAGIGNITVSGSRLYFTANDGTTGTELWASDGTTDGTYRVTDINPGASSANAAGLMAVAGGRVVFGTSQGITGVDLWVSDGTPSGTVPLADVRGPEVPFDSPFVSPVGLVPSAADPNALTAVFGADDGARGQEPWAVAVPAVSAPVANAGGPYAVGEGQPLTLTAAGSSGPIDAYEWDVDYDGATFTADLTGRTVTFPAADGPLARTVAVRVTGQGGTSTATATVTVSNLAPTVDLGPDRTGTEGAAITVPAAVADPSWNTPAGAAGGDPVTVAWTVTAPGGAVVASGAGPQQAATFTPADDGVYTVSFAATDDDGASATDTALVTVANVAPVIEVSGQAGVDEGATYTLNLVTTDPGADTIASVTIDWGDGTVQAVPGDPATVAHVYDDGPAVRPVLVRVTDEDGSFDAAQNGATSGGLVAAFGTGGLATTAVGTGTADIAEEVLAQPDGKVVLVGWANNGNNPQFALTRYTADGALDPTFGTGGKVLTSFPEATSAFAKGAVLQPDGKILAVGYSYFDYVLVARYNADGSLDDTFSGDGRLATRFAPGYNAGWAVAVDAQGRVVVAGHHAFNDFAVMRLLPDGTPDPAFGGGDGVTVTDVGNGQGDQAHDMKLLPDGRIALGGWVGRPGGGENDVAVAVYRADGTLDPAFSGDGIAIADTGTSEYPEAVAVDAQGRILVGGTGYVGGTDGRWVLVRFNPDGTRDAAFGGNPPAVGGIVENPMGSNDLVQDILVDAAGRVLAVGSDALSRIVRYRPDGTRDASFGQGGAVGSLGVPANQVLAAAFAADGNLLVAGQADTGGGQNVDFLVAKLQTVGEHQVSVRNVAPTAAWTLPDGVHAGDPALLTLVPADPSAADAAAGFRYSFDFNDDGDFDDAGDVRDATAASVLHAFPAVGTFTVRGRVTDKDGGAVLTTTAVAVTAAPPPAVRTAAVGGGGPAAQVQRSKVDRVTVTFNRAVAVGPDTFALARRGTPLAGVTVSAANPTGDLRTWVVTFAGPGTAGGSLPDGIYDLSVRAAGPAGGSAAGPATAADYVASFHRLFSDADGDGDSDNADLFQFRASYGRSAGDPAYRPEFDFDADGDVDNADLFQVRSRRSVEFKGY